MKYQKKVISDLNLCYSLAELTYKGQHCFLVAAEKHDPCYLFDEAGTKIAEPWAGPGGVMTMQQVPEHDGQFLATNEFYSPNDSKNARIIICTPDEEGKWDVRTLVDAPFVHRFGILKRNGIHYLIICCLKSGHEYKDDWRFPGGVYAAVLPENLDDFDENNQLKLVKLKDGMLKNHGYCATTIDGVECALVTCDEGVFLFTPPESPVEQWEIKQLLDVPASDAVICDFDSDGKLELGIIEKFHGDVLSIYRINDQGKYEKCWEYPEKLEMLHAIWAGTLCGKKRFVVGNRRGNRKTIAVSWEAGEYQTEIIEENTGAANILHFMNKEGKDIIVAANREINEVAMFIFEK